MYFLGHGPFEPYTVSSQTAALCHWGRYFMYGAKQITMMNRLDTNEKYYNSSTSAGIGV